MNVSEITGLMPVVSGIVAVILLLLFVILAVRRGKKGDRKKLYAVRTAVWAVCLAVLVAANIAISMFSNIINQHFSAVAVDDVALDQATADAQEMCTEIEEEGIVLLENKEGTLPLDTASQGKINLFGMAAYNLVYGGSGSGASDESNNIDLVTGLENAGFEVNEELEQFYVDNSPEAADTNVFNLQGGDYNIYEPALSEYSDSLISDAQSYSDTAVIVFSRSGGEGGDLPMDMTDYEGGDAGKHYLELQDVERDLLSMVEEHFDRVIVLINSSNAMELGFLEEENVDAALWIGGPGATGCDAVGEVLAGTVNPSGRLTDIYAYDVMSSPASLNCGNFFYTSNGEKTSMKYVDYAEGIYVGYRYYETRYVDNETGEIDEDAYQAAVQYPFGYGLSYTTFDEVIVSHDVVQDEDGADEIEVKVKVTNTGDTSGKQVVQLYYTAPYTVGGIEKAQVVLGDFAKTGNLAAGESETVTLTITASDMASYDMSGEGGYVLEAGDYQIRLMDNSHDEIESFTYTVDETQTVGDSSNLFADAAGDVNYVSRADWEGTLPTERVESKEITSDVEYALNKDNINAIYCSDDPEAEAITTGAQNGLTLEDMVGVDYDDAQWDSLLDEMTVDEMSTLIGFGGFATAEVASVGKATTIDIDGPAGLNALTSDISGVQYPSEVVIAATWNTELAERMGQVYAAEANAHGVNGVYAPACNIHRTPFSGRNFEYYSEDPTLSGKIGSAESKGINELGICTYVKHFALNDQETNRSGIAVWANEQAIREIYLAAFEPIVRSGSTSAVMTSYNRIGAVWAGGNQSLITGILREEWDFHGVVITDYDNGGYMNVDQSLRAGGDLMLSTLGHTPSEVTTGSNYGLQQMRRACKNILYMVVNSRAYTDPVTMQDPYWLYAALGVDALAVVLLAITAVTVNGKKRDKTK